MPPWMGSVCMATIKEPHNVVCICLRGWASIYYGIQNTLIRVPLTKSCNVQQSLKQPNDGRHEGTHTRNLVTDWCAHSDRQVVTVMYFLSVWWRDRHGLISAVGRWKAVLSLTSTHRRLLDRVQSITLHNAGGYRHT